MPRQSMVIDVRGGTAQDAELRGIAGWLQDEEDFARDWEFTVRPAQGTAGIAQDLAIALTTTVLSEAARSLVNALAGWMSTRRRLGQGEPTVVEVRVPGRAPVEITEDDLTAEKVPDLVQRIWEELEAATSGEE
ncbi:effector-associated constant component EACC1 [Streptomyces sp. P1-3]|uniref:effector-associated constant component EACC1 n=1 Tax=Streptomyces sp. P1-3 TaxID=3421658 RepID=UPI003D35EB7A